jgi:2-keto-3-deoxy-L-rhamnonate aldolase RhmA
MLELRNRARGVFVKLSSTEVIDMVAAAGFRFAVVDLEHSQLSETDARTLVRHARAIAFPALVRIPEPDRGAINRLLEAGAAGIQLSTVRSAGQVRAARSFMRYAPEGSRSVSLAHPQAGYGGTALAGYLAAQATEPPLLVAQIETATTDDPLEEILAARPDVVFIGTTDLAVDLGLDDGRVRERIEAIALAAQAADIPLGAFALDDERVVYDLAASDLSLLRGALANAA